MKDLKAFIKKIESLQCPQQRIINHVQPFLESTVQQNITDPVSPHVPNAPLTMTIKGSKHELTDTGELRASIKSMATENDIIVGSQLKKAPVLHFGAKIKPKKAQKLALPATRNVAKMTDLRNVKGTLDFLKNSGWKIFFKDKYIGGIKPIGGKALGLKSKYYDKKSKKNKPFYILYIRKEEVTIPPRPFLFLNNNQINELKQIALEAII